MERATACIQITFNTLVLVDKVVLRRVRLLQGWLTVWRQLNYLGEPLMWHSNDATPVALR